MSNLLVFLAAAVIGIAGAAGVHYLPPPWPFILIMLGVSAGLPCLVALAPGCRRGARR